MKDLTLGKKISLGFAALLVILVATGSFSILKMKDANVGSRHLSDDYVPELDIAGRMQSGMSEVRFNGRSYQFTGDKSYLEKCRKALADVKTALTEAEALAAKSTKLVKLKEQVKIAPALLAAYEALLLETEKTEDALELTRKQAFEAATSAHEGVNGFIQRQNADLAKQINDKAEIERITETITKAKHFNDAVDILNAARIANFKAQALRDSKILEDGLNKYKKVHESMATVTPLIRAAEDLKKFEVLKTDFKNYEAALGSTIAELAKMEEVGARRGKAAKDVETFINEIGEAAQKGATAIATEASASLGISSSIMVSSIITALVIGVLLAIFITRGITRAVTAIVQNLSAGAEQTSSAANQVSSASQTLAEGNSESAASLEETSASIEEMSSMIKRNAEAANKAKIIASETRAAADIGSADMVEMKTAMDEIKTSSADIAKIIKTIDEIAFQTNILALNAAVEAARAGEAGAGFAVVADEVRNLAQRSAQSAKETAEKIETAIGKSERGVQISAKVATNFNLIASKTREVDQYVGEIATATNEQAQGIAQISVAISQMDKVTQSNAASAEESASAAEELSAQAESMKDAVAELLQLVGSSESTGKPQASLSHAAKATRPAAKGHANGSQKPAWNLSALPMPPPRKNTPGVAAGDFKDF